MHKFTRLAEKLKKIFKYLPLLWDDEDWDYEYLIELIRFKLKRMRCKFIENNIVGEQDLTKMLIGIDNTLIHIERFTNDDKFDELNGGLPFKITFKSEPVGNGCYHQVTYNENTGSPLTKREEEIYRKYLIDKQNFEEQEWNAIFDTIKAEGRKWWD